MLGLDRVEFIPAAVPAHKSLRGMLDFSFRAELVEAAIAHKPYLSINRMEAERAGPSYTVDTIKALCGQCPDAEFSFILGQEDLLTLPAWKQGLFLPFLLAGVVILRRGEGDRGRIEQFIKKSWPQARYHVGDCRSCGPYWHVPCLADVESLGLSGTCVSGKGRLVFADIPRLDISASAVRSYWLADRSLAGLVPAGVVSLLERHRQYVSRIWSAAKSRREGRAGQGRVQEAGSTGCNRAGGVCRAVIRR